MPARVSTSLCYLHEAVSGGMGRRQKDASGGLGELKLFLRGAPFSTRPSPVMCSRDVWLPLPTGPPPPDGRAVHRPALASVSREGC